MQFRWLGPLLVGPDGRVRGSRERRLLALLLLEAPNGVARATAAEWIGADREGSAAALNVTVSRLRRQLAALAPDASIDSSAGQLRLDNQAASDVERFRELIADARALPLGGTARSQAFTDALALWRDHPFAGEDLPPHPAVDALAELRLTAIDERYEALLAADGELDIGELLASCREQPYRERRWALAMRALYRAGRQAEALDLYHEARRHLVEDLGLEPGVELAETEALILRHDPSLRGAAPGGPASPPTSLTDLIGREAELDELLAKTASRRLVNLVGPGGVGKTRLAAAVFARLIGEDTPGCFVRLDAVARGGSVVRALLTDLQVPGRPGLAAEDVLVEHLAGTTMLVVLDNCEHVLDNAATAAQLLLGASPNIRILATSREPLGIPGEVLHTVPPLRLPAPEDTAGPDTEQSPAVQLFLQRAADASTQELATDDRSLIAEIVRRLEGLPLAIEIAAASSRHRSLTNVLNGLRADQLPQHRLRGVPSRHNSLDAALNWSRELIAPDDAAALDRLSTFAGWFDTADAAQLLCDAQPPSSVDARETENTLARLVAASLVSFAADRPKGHRLLEPIRAHCRDHLARRPLEADAAAVAHLRWCINRSTELGPRIDGPDQIAVLRAIDELLPDLRRGLANAVTTAEWAVMGLQAANPLTRYWWLRTTFAEGRDWFSDLLTAAEPAQPPPELTAPALTGMGFLQLVSGDETGAVTSLETAVDQWRSCTSPDGLPVSLHYLARAAWGVYPPPDIRRLIDEAAATLDTTARPADAFIVHILATMWHCMFGDAENATTAAQQTWEYATRSGAPNSLAHAHEALALAACARQEPHLAAPELVAAQQIYRQLGNLGCAAHCLEFTAWQQAQTGQPDTALHLLSAAAHARTLHAAPIASYEFIGRTKTLQLLALDQAAIPTAPNDLTLDEALATALAATSRDGLDPGKPAL